MTRCQITVFNPWIIDKDFVWVYQGLRKWNEKTYEEAYNMLKFWNESVNIYGIRCTYLILYGFRQENIIQGLEDDYNKGKLIMGRKQDPEIAKALYSVGILTTMSYIMMIESGTATNSMSLASKVAQLDPFVVQIRNEIAHGCGQKCGPSLSELRWAAHLCKEWLAKYYWTYHAQYFESIKTELSDSVGKIFQNPQASWKGPILVMGIRKNDIQLQRYLIKDIHMEIFKLYDPSNKRLKTITHSTFIGIHNSILSLLNELIINNNFFIIELLKDLISVIRKCHKHKGSYGLNFKNFKTPSKFYSTIVQRLIKRYTAEVTTYNKEYKFPVLKRFVEICCLKYYEELRPILSSICSDKNIHKFFNKEQLKYMNTINQQHKEESLEELDLTDETDSDDSDWFPCPLGETPRMAKSIISEYTKDNILNS